MSSRISRTLFLLSLFVLTQACAAASVGRQTAQEPRGGDRGAKLHVKELSGCSGERFRIDLLDAIEKIPDDTLDAQREQLRDWVFTVTLARIAQSTNADEVLAGIADEPLVRDDALAHVLHMQSGPTRSTSTKSGGAIVLVEADEPASMAAEVAEAIDEEALHVGGTPAEAQVYQYVFQPEVARAEVCAMKPIARAEIESAGRRHRSATITTAADFEAFLSGGIDLLSAQCTEAGLEVKGRQRPRGMKTPITVEHIAALSQARGTRFVPLARFGASLDELSKSNRATVEANARLVDTLRAPLEIQSPEIQIVSAWKRQNPGVSTAQLWMSLELQKESVGQPGFSLDPHTSSSFATKILDRCIEALPDVQEVAAILRGLEEEERAEELLDIARYTNEPFAAEAKEALIAVRAKLVKAKDEQAEAILHPTLPPSRGNDLAVDLLRVVAKRSAQQCARYDGPLLGTATGMTFFYTDLLAKIWQFDLNGAAPEGPVEGFQSSIHGSSDTTSCGESNNKNTRMWLGLREEGFSREPSGLIRFEPIATRIFAKSSNVGAREEEFEATPDAKRFVQWWDDHFAEIAEWEPQYEVLNQLMKWSVVIHNATIAGKHACFAPLDGVAVRADHRIDKWIAETNGLRWRGPVELLRSASGAEGKPGDPECMELFESARYLSCERPMRLIGGVSAASVQQVQAKAMRATATPPQLGRLGAEVAPIEAGPGRVRFVAVPRSGGKLENVTVESTPAATRFRADIRSDVTQVGASSSWDKRLPIKQIDKSIEVGGKAIVASERKNGLVSAELKTTDLLAAEVKVEVESSTLLQVKAEAQKVAKSMLQDGVRLADAAVPLASRRAIVKLGEERIAYPVEIGGSKKWVIMESGGGNRGPPPAGAVARFRVGVPGNGSHLPGSPQASRAPSVTVTVVDKLGEKEAGLVEANPPGLALVKEKIGSSDIDGAMKVLGESPSAEARSLLLGRALEAGDDANVARVADNAIRKGASPAELGALGEKIQKEIVLRTRDARDTGALEQQVMRLAITERRLQTPGRLEAQIGGTERADAIYTPTSYPVSAELPPAVHPPGKLVMPDEQYVTRTLAESSPRELPKKIEVNGVQYESRAVGREVALDYGAVGSSWRLLLAGQRTIRVVVRCDDRDPASPPCHERPSPEERKMYEEAMTCDLDGDRRLEGAPERDCLDAQQRKRKAAERSAPAQSAP